MLVPGIFHHNFMDDMFEDVFRLPKTFGQFHNSTGLMNTDVTEQKDKYLLDVELPGCKKEDIQAELREGYLTITASREEQRDEKNEEGKYIRKERYSGGCKRSFYVGEAVTEEDIHANFENGILKLEIPKKEKKAQVEEHKYIAIEG